MEEVEFEQQKTVRIMLDQRILFQAEQRINQWDRDTEKKRHPKSQHQGSKFQLFIQQNIFLNHRGERALKKKKNFITNS